MTDENAANPPSPFIARWITRLAAEGAPHQPALDLAMGRGRHALAMAAARFSVTGIDNRLDALLSARASALRAKLPLMCLCADVTSFPLPPAHFHLIVVSRYLDRALFPALRDALVPGGVVLYETFTENQLRYGRGPRSSDHLLKPGELRMRMRGMEVLFDEEVTEPDAVARIAARRR
jgi:tellurite methyltransferase